MGSEKNWQKCSAQIFWGEIAPANHIIQIYNNDQVILNSLSGFVTCGLQSDDSVIVIATKSHINSLELKLIESGFNLKSLRSTDRYISINAEKALKQFMVNGWPDEARFMDFINSVISRAGGKGKRRVRAYGEMVALLWAEGHHGATVNLEHLWNRLCGKKDLSLFCAYPKSGFTQDTGDSIRHICEAHTKMISGDLSSPQEVFYKNSEAG